MNMPETFDFTQSNLQDYIDCPYRFNLRYIQHAKWPALIVDDALEFEQRGQTGGRFHRLIQQYLLGIPEERLTDQVAADPSPEMMFWWEDFLQFVPPLLEGTRYVETILSTGLAGHRVVAKFDLVLVQSSGKLVIFDWKTSRRQPKQKWLEERIQTRLYRFLLAQSGCVLNGGEETPPEQIEMNYWFTSQPELPISLPYSQGQYEQDLAFFTNLIREIAELPDNGFLRTADLTKCRYCVYRSHCDRGTVAGNLDEFEDFELTTVENDDELDFDQIEEIAF
ncbi:PD-(D/E)XK nuclease family protein [Chloroflexota bacterium]|nr:PD-(D/E)XK nuclease family protein [Chloroflexota bacterium]